MYMFPTEFINSPSKFQYNTLNLWPLWRSIRVWALITANFTNHTDFFFTLIVIGWGDFPSLRIIRLVLTALALKTVHAHIQICNLPQENMHFKCILIRINISSHQSDLYYLQRFAVRIILHKTTHHPLLQRAVLKDNGRKNTNGSWKMQVREKLSGKLEKGRMVLCYI